jgi:hypothetical protein
MILYLLRFQAYHIPPILPSPGLSEALGNAGRAASGGIAGRRWHRKESLGKAQFPDFDSLTGFRAWAIPENRPSVAAPGTGKKRAVFFTEEVNRRWTTYCRPSCPMRLGKTTIESYWLAE